MQAGLCSIESSDLPPEWGFDPGSLPPLGASPDAFIRHDSPNARPLTRPPTTPSSASSNGSGSASCGAMQRAQHEADEEALRGELAAVTLAGKSQTHGQLESGEMGDDGLLEIVELKNTCPFATAQPRFVGHLNTMAGACVGSEGGWGASRGPRTRGKILVCVG